MMTQTLTEYTTSTYNSQEREEYDAFNAEEFGERIHGTQLFPHGPIEEDEAIHGYELR